MANAAIEETDEGMAVESDIASDSGISARSGGDVERGRSGESRAALGAYGEDDDAATQLVEPLHSEPRWLVQITPFDRRSMETPALVSELLAGRLSPSTQVWRDGMADWSPLERVLDLPARPSGVQSAAAAASHGAGAGRAQAHDTRSTLGSTAARRASGELYGASTAFAARSAALAGPVFWLVNAAVALAVAAATLGVLSAGGVFQ